MNMIEKLQQHRELKETLNWTGNFIQYLDLVKQNPSLADHAHARIYKMIKSAGIEEVDGKKRYKFFDSEIYGLDINLEKLIEEYLHPAARRLDVRKRVLLLMGPVSGGKSTIVTILKKGLERYSKTDEGAVYAISGCPMQEDPLHLIPKELRSDFEKSLNIKIEGNLCPVCQYELDHVHNGKIEDVQVERIFLSEERRVGIGTFAPSDPKSQDISDLTGSINFSTITEYGSEADPRAYSFDGEINKANRGIMEFQEMLKCDEKFLYSLLSLSQEGNFKAGRFALISADELIVAHTNEYEYKNFVSNKKNEALMSRIVVIPVPYNLKTTEEVKIYEKLIGESNMQDIHIAPHALNTASIFSVLSRMTASKKQGMDALKKVKLYDGKDVEGFKVKDLAEIQAEGVVLGEGMGGIDPRFIINRISSTLIKSSKGCINALDILRSIKDGLDQHPSITADEKNQLLNMISVARGEFDEVAKKEVQKSFVFAYEEQAKNIFENYLENVEAYCNSEKLLDPITNEELEVDEKLMRGLEEQIGVSENAKKMFREEILIRISSYAMKKKPFTYESHERLREAIEKKLFSDLKDSIKLTTSAKNPDKEQSEKISAVAKNLIETKGYCSVCANELLKYTGSLLSR